MGDGNTWSALTEDEWSYLLKERTNVSSLYKCGVTVCGKTDCLIIAPDGFAGTIATSYDTSTWPAAEAAGLVCLPAAGGREGSNVINDGEYGIYWSSSVNNEGYPYLTSFMSNFFTPDDFIDGRYYGISVRLITESN